MALTKFLLAPLVVVCFAHASSLLDSCTGFRGPGKEPLPQDECEIAWDLNQRFASGEFDDWKYDKVRRMMNNKGLIGDRWHVGHIKPHVKGCAKFGKNIGKEDFGWNLFAQPASDNSRAPKQSQVPYEEATIQEAELKWAGRFTETVGATAPPPAAAKVATPNADSGVLLNAIAISEASRKKGDQADDKSDGIVGRMVAIGSAVVAFLNRNRGLLVAAAVLSCLAWAFVGPWAAALAFSMIIFVACLCGGTSTEQDDSRRRARGLELARQHGFCG